jgi:hypothetical protein
MNNLELSRQITRIKDLMVKVNEACGSNIEMQSHWAKYLCVLAAGLIENALKELYAEYAKRQVSEPVANFVSAHLSPIRNPKAEKFLLTASYFKNSWKDELNNFLQDEGRGDAIDSIMNNRHQIAHGKDRNVGLSFAQIKEYFRKALEVLEFIEQQCMR